MKRRFIKNGTMFLLSVMVVFLAYMISNRMIINNSDDILGKYSKEDYDYLLEIAEKVVVEGKGILTEEIPKGVYYKIEGFTNEEENITFTYGLFRSGLNSPEMTITLSKKDKKILGKDSIYKTEKDYKEHCNKQAKFFSVCIGLMCAIVIMLIKLFYEMYSYIQISKQLKN